MALPTAKELLHVWDQARPRSRQVEIGVSQLGACRRQTGYMLAGYPPDEGYEDDNTQATMGTAIHQVLAEAGVMVIPGAQAETLEVSFAGLMGHPDLWVDGVVRDYKTVSYNLQLESRRQLGPPLRERWQVMVYAAGCILAGWPTHAVQINWIARDSGEEHIWTEPFDPAVVEDAMNWLDDVRTSDVEMLSRDYRPDSAICQSCPYYRICWDAEPGRDPRSVLYRDDPDAAKWAAQLADARKRKKAAEDEIADALGALDALRTVSRPGEKEYVRVPGMDRDIRFAVNRGKRSPDMAQIANDYKRADARPPMKTGDPVISVALVKPKEIREPQDQDPAADEPGS